MNKNSLLNIANISCNLFKVVIGLFIIGMSFLFIHFQVDRNYYDNWRIQQPESDAIIQYTTISMVGEKPYDEQKIKITDWKSASLYFTFFKIISILVLIYLSINQFNRILKSVKRLESFQKTNVVAFRKIGFYCLLISGLSFFSFWEFGDYTKNSLSVSLGTPLIALLALILAEIFKEGNNLMEENQLTI